MTVASLDDAEFADELVGSLGNDLRWHRFVDPDGLVRTQDALCSLIANLDAQVLRRGESPDVDLDWLGRVKGLRRLASSRLKEVSRRIWREDGSHTQREHEWKAFAHELCEIIEDSDMSSELDALDAPFGDITAQQWVSRRRVKRGLAA